MVRRWQLLGEGRMGRAYDLHERTVAKAHSPEEFLANLANELLLGEVLADLTRNQLSLLLVAESEVLGHDLQIFLVHVLQVVQLGAAVPRRDISARVFAGVVVFCGEFADDLVESYQVDLEESVQVPVDSLL